MTSILKKSPINENTNKRLHQVNPDLKKEYEIELENALEIKDKINDPNTSDLLGKRLATVTDALFESELLSVYEDCTATDILLQNIFGVKLHAYQDNINLLSDILREKNYVGFRNYIKVRDGLFCYADEFLLNCDRYQTVSFENNEDFYIIVIAPMKSPKMYLFKLDNKYDTKKDFFKILYYNNSLAEFNKSAKKDTSAFICSQAMGSTLIDDPIENVKDISILTGFVNESLVSFDLWASLTNK